MSAYRITLADDHVLLRQGLRRIVEESSGLEVVGEAGDGMELLRLLNKTVPDLIILDISMPNLRGIEAICEIKGRHAGVKVLVLTMHRDKEYLYQAVSSGADGYLLKDDADTELFSAIRKIRHGEFYVSPSLVQELKEYRKQMGRGAAGPIVPLECLTIREREVLKLIAEGKSSREIAALLYISARTVDHHRANIMSKLNLRKTVDLVKYAITKGYTQTVSPA
jgi:two-component system, NarL family, response regulator NreC